MTSYADWKRNAARLGRLRREAERLSAMGRGAEANDLYRRASPLATQLGMRSAA